MSSRKEGTEHFVGVTHITKRNPIISILDQGRYYFG